MNKSQKSFNPPKYQCPACKDYLSSSYEGEFVECTCGDCFIDSTRHYTRVGGNATFIEGVKE